MGTGWGGVPGGAGQDREHNSCIAWGLSYLERSIRALSESLRDSTKKTKQVKTRRQLTIPRETQKSCKEGNTVIGCTVALLTIVFK